MKISKRLYFFITVHYRKVILFFNLKMTMASNKIENNKFINGQHYY